MSLRQIVLDAPVEVRRTTKELVEVAIRQGPGEDLRVVGTFDVPQSDGTITKKPVYASPAFVTEWVAKPGVQAFIDAFVTDVDVGE